MATQTQEAAYRSPNGECGSPAGSVTLSRKRLNETPATGDPVRPRAANSIHERGRHVWDSKSDASTRRRMARAPTAVGWGRAIADSRRSFGRHRPLRRAKAEG